MNTISPYTALQEQNNLAASAALPDKDSSKDEEFEGDFVEDPTDSDVLCGRGGSINSHPGNERFRKLVEKRKRVYLTARFKREKRLIASSIVSEIRALNPPGRFLQKDTKSGKWKDIGDEKARDKTSQALRENAPSIRAEIEVEIKEQRAEMAREEQDTSQTTAAAQAPPPPYAYPWGYPPFYAYPGHPPPPPPPHGYYPPGPWGPYPPPPPGYAGPHPGAAPEAPKSALEQTAELVASGAESIKSWTKSTLGVAGSASVDNHDNVSRSSAHSKPLVYVHDDKKRRRMVKFREDSNLDRPSMQRRLLAQSSANSAGGYSASSLIDGDMEPHDLDVMNEGNNSSLMTQMANQIFTSFGSWDASTLCGYENGDEKVPFPKAEEGDDDMEPVMEEDMHVEWEGQEVLLVDQNQREPSPERMPPPARRPNHHDAASSVGFSSIGSCHSWIPEQFSTAASYFSSSRGGLSPAASMDMDTSAVGTENFSTGGSIGGGSLTRVFENEVLEEPVVTSPVVMNQRMISQMPSWERTLRSRSPLSVASGEDETVISRSSSKMSDGPSFLGQQAMDGMAWERHRE